MTTKSRIRQAPDQGRMGALVRAPGIDTRCWFAMGRIDDDPDAIRWAPAGSDDGPLGWLCDVSFIGGPYDQMTSVVCRWVRNGGRTDPPDPNCLVLVSFPEGQSNGEPKIIGTVYTEDCPPPEAVNGSTIVETDPQDGEVAALATHITVSAKALDEEYGGSIRRRTPGTHRLLADELLELAEEDATQSYIRGEDIRDALNDLAGAVEAGFRALTTGGSTSTGGVPLTAAQAALTGPPGSGVVGAVQAFRNAAEGYLSDRIKGE